MIARRLAALALLAFAPVACTSGQVGQLPTVTSANPASFKLQFAVGVATISDASGVYHGINLLETFRNASGASATTTNTPTITGPANAFGSLEGISTLAGLTPSTGEQLAAQPTDPTLVPQPPIAPAFGLTGGAFGYGFASDNLVDPNVFPAYQAATGAASCPELVPSTLTAPGQPTYTSLHYGFYQQPVAVFGAGLCNLLHAASPQANPEPFVGGPPIWPSPAGYGQPLGFPGWSPGFTIVVPCAASSGAGGCSTPGAPVSGAYALDVAVSNGGANSNSYTRYDASATLPPAAVGAPLPALAAPTVQINADGTGLVNLNVPADPRIVETIVFVSVPDCGQTILPPAGSEPVHYYSLITKQTGQQTLFLSNLGPPDASGTPTHTFCNAADLAALANVPGNSAKTFSYSVSAVAFDYGAFEASFPTNRQTAPSIAGAGGTSDLSLSNIFTCAAYAPPPTGQTVACSP